MGTRYNNKSLAGYPARKSRSFEASAAVWSNTWLGPSTEQKNIAKTFVYKRNSSKKIIKIHYLPNIFCFILYFVTDWILWFEFQENESKCMRVLIIKYVWKASIEKEQEKFYTFVPL